MVAIGSISSAHLLFSEKIHSLLSDSESLGKYLEDKVTGRVCPGVQKTSMTEPKMLYAMPSPPPTTWLLTIPLFSYRHWHFDLSVSVCMLWLLLECAGLCSFKCYPTWMGIQCQFQNSTSKSIFQVSLLCPTHHSMQVRTFFVYYNLWTEICLSVCQILLWTVESHSNDLSTQRGCILFV